MAVTSHVASGALELIRNPDFLAVDGSPHGQERQYSGVDIRHPEDWAGQEAPLTEGTIGSILHVFEPTPDTFIHAMVYSKWETAFLMDLHFIGLVPHDHWDDWSSGYSNHGICQATAHRTFAQVCPLRDGWIRYQSQKVTGMLVLIGMPVYYTFDIAFWLKLLALMLLGLNAAAFYFTDTFGGVEHVKAGEDAAMSAKREAAASSLVLVVCSHYFGPLYSESSRVD